MKKSFFVLLQLIIVTCSLRSYNGQPPTFIQAYRPPENVYELLKRVYTLDLGDKDEVLKVAAMRKPNDFKNLFRLILTHYDQMDNLSEHEMKSGLERVFSNMFLFIGLPIAIGQKFGFGALKNLDQEELIVLINNAILFCFIYKIFYHPLIGLFFIIFY